VRVVYQDLKYEEVYRSEYRDLAEARAVSACSWKKSITKNAYTPRLLFAPAEFERDVHAQTKRRPLRATSLMSFLRHGEIYHFDEGAILRTTPSLIETMSFQLAIPWQVALLQSLPPLHQPAPSCKKGLSRYNAIPANGRVPNCLSHPGTTQSVAIMSNRKCLCL